MSKQDCKVFVGGLSWETTGEKLRSYFENFGAVREAFVSYNRNNGKPRGFGFVSFEGHEVADKVVATKHTIDRREVEAKRAIPKDENAKDAAEAKDTAPDAQQKTRKIFVGGLAPGVDDAVLRQYFEQFGDVEDAVVMYDHDNKRPRGFGFVSVSMPSALSASLQQQQQAPAADSSAQQVSSASSYTGSGTGGSNNATLQSAAAAQQQAAVAAAAVNGYGDLYALSNGGNGMFATPAQAAALYNIANSAFPQHLNGMQTGASDVNSKLSSLGQQGLNSLKALAAGYSPYGGEGQHTGSYDSDAEYAGADATVFAEQVSTRMAGLTVGAGSYSSPFTSANTMGSGWSH